MELLEKSKEEGNALSPDALIIEFYLYLIFFNIFH